MQINIFSYKKSKILNIYIKKYIKQQQKLLEKDKEIKLFMKIVTGLDNHLNESLLDETKDNLNHLPALDKNLLDKTKK